MSRKTIQLTVTVLLSCILFACEKEDENKPLIFSNIRITKLPDKTTFRIGEEIDLTGLEVSNIYTDSSRTVNKSYKLAYTVEDWKPGTYPVNVSALGRTVTFNITVTNELMDTGLPVLYIETENQQPITSKEDYVNASMTIKDKDKVLFQNTLRIRGRGNATWYSYPKKPYRLKLDEKADLFGFGSDKDWVLLANYCDKTLMRTAIAFQLSERMKFPWTPKYRFVEVVLNGEYIGNYNFTEHIKQGSNRVDIPKRGYLFERDGYYKQEPVWFESATRGYGYSFKNPDTDDITQAEIDYIKNYVDEFEAMLASSSFATEYKQHIDSYSFARWFVFQQMLANMDTNVYISKDDQNASKLFMGPVWDFEWSIGIGWYEGSRPRPADYWVWNGNAFYFDRLLQDADFRTVVKSVWNEYKSENQHLLSYYEELRSELAESQKLNFRRWNIMNERVSVGGVPMGGFDKEVDCDIQFFKNHINWLETAIGGL
ncbi:MAG: CotH kinase family protein [Dysgonamonadaceae bacterium]|jgi:hypothetical protein|nr:CotH kinase family protein [Dysgonamonadaceae bacterium]